MNYVGILIGLATFLIIGLFHPLVIKGEYYFGTRCWWAFLVTGILCAGLSLYVENVYLSIIFGVISFSSFWGILEVFDQRKRGTERLVPEKSQTTERLRINRPSFLYHSHSLPFPSRQRFFLLRKNASPFFYIPLFQALEYSVKNMRQMKNHSPEIDFSFSCKRFSVCRKMINAFIQAFFCSNLPIYPKEQPHAISPMSYSNDRRGIQYKSREARYSTSRDFPCRICYDIRTNTPYEIITCRRSNGCTDRRNHGHDELHPSPFHAQCREWRPNPAV